MHDDPWRAQRDALVWGRYGLAALTMTQWLDPVPRIFDGLPGVWHAEAGTAVGELPDERLVLNPGDEHLVDGILLRGFARDGAIAVRMLDPRATTRRGIGRIERFPVDPALQVAGRVVADPSPVMDTLAVDGHVGQTTYHGAVDMEISGARLRLLVEANPDGSLFASLSDATSGGESYPFRFLRIDAPDPGGAVEVDFNRLHLPPCAFSDHYVCVMPPPDNRWEVALRGGEARVHWDREH